MVQDFRRLFSVRLVSQAGDGMFQNGLATLFFFSPASQGTAASIAGIQAAKRTPDLVPLCHPIAIHGVTVECEITDDGVAIVATVRTADRTGVEMEALTCVAVAGLTLVDMVKAVDRAAVITDVRVEEKTGGHSGTWRRR